MHDEHRTRSNQPIDRGGSAATPDQRTLAGVITLTEAGIDIDGQVFPWHIATDATITDHGGLQGLTVEIFCDKVQVDAIPRNATVQVAGRVERCTDHKPVQHRDARPPWCSACGLTADGHIPQGPLDRRADQ